MKKIECIIPNNRFPDLQKELRQLGIYGMTVSDVKGFGNQQTRPEQYLFLPKTKVELYCRDSDVEKIVNVISETCRSDQLGSGKVAIFQLEQLIRIRTGETGEVAV